MSFSSFAGHPKFAGCQDFPANRQSQQSCKGEQIKLHTFPKICNKKSKQCSKSCKRSFVISKAANTDLLQRTTVSQNGAAQPGLIFAPSNGAQWDAGSVSNPAVRYFRTDEEERWMMWYNGCSPEGAAEAPALSRIGVALSQDGIHWERASKSAVAQSSSQEGQCMATNEDWWWHDTRHVSLGDVQMSSSEAVSTGEGVYWMYYSGGNFEESPVPDGMPGLNEGQHLPGLRSRVGLALSQDGYNFARIEAEHHSGALFDAGEEQDWDRVGNAAPQVLSFGASDRKMYYNAFDPERRKWIIGLATSKDGFVWRKQGPIFEGGQDSEFDALGAAHHHIVRDVDSRRYVMFYEAVDRQNNRTISIAVSKDGVKGWKRLARPILSAGSTGWDSTGVGAPCPVSMAGGRWRLYYTGWNAETSRKSIGLAITDKDNLDTFEGVRIAFKRRSPV